MSLKIIGKSILGDKGFCQLPSKMEPVFDQQLDKILSCLPGEKEVIMTSMTGNHEVKLTDGTYFPKIREFNPKLIEMFDPLRIYTYCNENMDKFRPGCDFIVWDSKQYDIVATTFSREAPILAFESFTGKKALGVILIPSLMQYGDYLFSAIKEYLCGRIKVTLVTCNHYGYAEGAIPDIVHYLANKNHMVCSILVDSEKEPECYHRGEKGNHVVAMW